MPSIHSDSRRQLLMDAALEIIREGGLESLSMGTLASRVRLSRPAIYQYFDSREHVLGELLLDEMADLSNEMDRLLTEIADPMEQVRVWLHFSLAFMSSERHKFVSEIPVGQLPEDQRGMLRAMHGFYTSSLISPLMELGVRDSTSTAHLILGLVGAAAKRIDDGADFSVEANALEAFVDAGVRASTSGPGA